MPCADTNSTTQNTTPNNHQTLFKKNLKKGKGGVGYITKEMIAAHMPAPSEAGGVVFVCGPPPMMKALSGDKAPDKVE